MNTPTMSSGSHGEQAKRTFAAAVRFAGVIVAAAVAVLVLGLLWVSGCKSGTGEEALAQCGGVQRNLLGIGSPLILLLGGLGAFVRRARRSQQDTVGSASLRLTEPTTRV